MSGKKVDTASTPEAPAPTTGDAAPRDVLFVHGTSEDGRGLNVLRFSEDRVSSGELREARDGQPIVGELVALTQRSENERLFDVSVLARGPAAPAKPAALAAKGPAKVASDAYREGWENVFGARDKGAKPN